MRKEYIWVKGGSMKIRSGFVSNSSSSSFVMIGFETNVEESSIELARKLYGKVICNEDKATDLVWGNRWEPGMATYIADSDSGWLNKGSAFVGVVLADFASDDGSVPDSIDAENIMIKVKELEKNFERKDRTIFYFGTHSC